jgi:mono/diheme cytochrome c family protein
MNLLRTISLVLILGSGVVAFARSGAKPPKSGESSAVVSSPEPDPQSMLEGEKRYRANCGRCHQPPHKFPPRAMAMAVRHMRVRAMLTEEDVKYVLYFVTH